MTFVQWSTKIPCNGWNNSSKCPKGVPIPLYSFVGDLKRISSKTLSMSFVSIFVHFEPLYSVQEGVKVKSFPLQEQCLVPHPLLQLQRITCIIYSRAGAKSVFMGSRMLFFIVQPHDSGSISVSGSFFQTMIWCISGVVHMDPCLALFWSQICIFVTAKQRVDLLLHSPPSLVLWLEDARWGFSR